MKKFEFEDGLFNDDKSSQLEEVKRISFENRNIYLFDELNHMTSKDVIEQMFAMDSIDVDDIVLYINSRGGNVDDGLSIVSTMEAINSDVITVIIGDAISMSGIISICGDKRLISQYGCWMGHEMTTGYSDYVSKSKYGMDWDIKTWKKLVTIIKNKTKLSEHDINVIKHGELWLSPEECLKKGVVDGILKHQ